MNWEFQYAVVARVPPRAAWRYWTDVRHWASDPGVEWVEIDGPFRKGTKGRTKRPGHEPVEWELTDVRHGRRAVIEMPMPDADARFTWRFEPHEEGRSTRLVQHVRLAGPDVATYAADALDMLAQGIREGMRRLAGAIERAADPAEPEAGADPLRTLLEEAEAEGIIDGFNVTDASVELEMDGRVTTFTHDGARAFAERMLRLMDGRDA